MGGGFSIARQLGLGVSRIVIDPGHGGHDPGAQGQGPDRSGPDLDVALRLEKLLQKEPGVEVVLTRRTDVYIPLEGAHRDRQPRRTPTVPVDPRQRQPERGARGIETYFLSFASSPDAEAVAARENSASEREMHQLPDMIKAIALNNKLDESRDLANMVQEDRWSRMRRTNKEVAQPRREEGAVRGADRRGDAERARRNLVPHQPAGAAAAEDAGLQAEDRRGAARRGDAVS